ncbi:MAG: hypothetical protein V4677_02225 [Bacteroidota bacterium]
MLISEIKRKLDLLSQINEINEEFLIKTILEEVADIKDSKIDKKSSILLDENNFELALISPQNNCNIYFEVFEPNTVDIQIGIGGEYLYQQKIKDLSDVYKLRGAIKDLLTSEISEELTKVNDKIIRSTYTVKHILNSVEQHHYYSAAFGFSPLFSKKQKIQRIYDAWL